MDDLASATFISDQRAAEEAEAFQNFLSDLQEVQAEIAAGEAQRRQAQAALTTDVCKKFVADLWGPQEDAAAGPAL